MDDDQSAPPEPPAKTPGDATSPSPPAAGAATPSAPPTTGDTAPSEPATAGERPALPGDVHRTQLPERVVPYWRISAVLGWLPLLVPAVAIALFVPGLPAAIGGLLIALPIIGCLVDVIVVQPRRREIWWYEIGDEQIDLQHGWLVVTRTVVPMTRVQHVELEHGPLAQRFDLAQLEIHTAAGSVKIPAMDRGEGERIRQHIADLARIADDL